MTDRLLIGLDRDGTIIKNDGYFAKDDGWQKSLELNEAVIQLLSYLQSHYTTTTIVLTNQSGVARGFFPTKRVEEVNQFLDKMLKKRGITIHNWQYCPDVDLSYAQKHPEVHWDTHFVKKITKRKPVSNMLLDGLKKEGKILTDFKNVLIIGDHEDDRLLAQNLDAYFIDVKEKSYNTLLLAWRKVL